MQGKRGGEGGCYAIFCLFFTADGAITKVGNFTRVSKRSVSNKKINIFPSLFPFFPGESSPPPASLLWGERENTRERGEKGKGKSGISRDFLLFSPPTSM